MCGAKVDPAAGGLALFRLAGENGPAGTAIFHGRGGGFFRSERRRIIIQ